jgi:hypothetical protein
MNAESISNLLRSEGRYKLAAQPLRVQDLEFKGDFDAVLEGPNDERGLVLVVDGTALPLSTIQRRLKALSSALTRTRSMRPTTVVLITQQPPDDSSVAELQALSRLIVISAQDNAKDCLRPLLHLKLPQDSKLPQEQVVKSADTILQEELGGQITDPFLSALIKAARKSPSDVERTVREQIDRAAKLEAPEGRSHD